MNTTESTRELLKRYYDSLPTKEEWTELLADDFLLSGTLPKESRGRESYAASGFFRMVKSHKVKEMIVEEERGFALVNYDLISSRGKMMSCDVAEFWKAERGKLVSVSIYFDTAAFNNFLSS